MEPYVVQASSANLGVEWKVRIPETRDTWVVGGFMVLSGSYHLHHTITGVGIYDNDLANRE